MILNDILAVKHEEVVRARRETPEAQLRASDTYAKPRHGFISRLRGMTGRRIIAEIKKASPSMGVIRQDFDPRRHAAEYEAAGAACISVLTDERFFKGGLDHLRAARQVCAIPILRKDFVIDAYQITEAREAGADAVLLIVSALDREQLSDLYAAAIEQSMDVLVEVHDEAEFDTALRLGAALIGVNNRNLKTFEVSTDVTRRLVAMAPAGTVIISESGLGDADELAELEALGVTGFLIGQTFMAAPDPGRALASLLSA